MSQSTETAPRLERSPKRVRVYLAGELVADTVNAWLVWENPNYPSYYLPADDLRAKLTPTGVTEPSPDRGNARLYDVAVSTASKPGAAKRYLSSPVPELRELVRLDWNAMDAWFEEDEPVYTHPRDPYSRVDILASSRHIRVELDGVTVADSRQPRILFETGARPRYYLPLTDVRLDLLRDSATTSHCPYKGTANYFTALVGERPHQDIAWIYRTPLPESQKIAGLIAFYNEKVDTYVDGELETR
jgi:uncharacterized protein (DUF427 family)